MTAATNILTPARVRRFTPPLPGRPALLALALFLIVGGVIVFVYLRSRPAPIELPPETFPAMRGPISATVSATGNVAAAKQAKLGFTGSGTIAAIDVNVGQQVAAGERLAQLSSET